MLPPAGPVGKADSDAQKAPDIPRNQNADDAFFRVLMGWILPIPFAVSAMISGVKGVAEAKKLPKKKGQIKSLVCMIIGFAELINFVFWIVKFARFCKEIGG